MPGKASPSANDLQRKRKRPTTNPFPSLLWLFAAELSDPEDENDVFFLTPGAGSYGNRSSIDQVNGAGTNGEEKIPHTERSRVQLRQNQRQIVEK